MGPSGSNYRDQGVQSGSLNRQSSKKGRERGVELADDFSRGERRERPVYDSVGKYKEKSLANLGSWEAESKFFTTKPERFMPSYDMDDSNFFAHTARLNIEGPHSDSTRFLRHRSSSTERSLISRGERTMATAATAFQKSDRSRSPSPPITLVPGKPTSPTDSYLKISLQSSLPLADPTASRKLLVLDLNGTLLLRSAHSGHRVPPPSYSRGRHSADSHSSSTRPYPALRTIYPRPYLPSFVAYIFHPTTLQWLDTMVWSSAQPHSVNDMVNKCFGAYKEMLKAVWARDTLGLSGDEYYRKTQTTKDLAKPWAQIHGDGGHVSIPQQHSALTTVLMDDSPLKAVLQPWNHLCVSEYGSERRKLDVEIAEREVERMWLAERERAKEVMEEETTTTDGSAAMKSNEEIDKEAERKRKRKEKKMLKKKKLLLEKEQLEAQGKEEVGKVEEERYDELLLAVIGILNELKHQGNVVGWMRSGGLVHVGNRETMPESHAVQGNSTMSISTSEAMTMTISIPDPDLQTTLTPTSHPTLSTKRDGSTVSIQGPSKRRRLTCSSDTEMYSDPVSTGERVLEVDLDSEMLPTTTRMTERSLSPLHSSPPPHSLSPLPSAQTEQTLTGVPLLTTTTGIKNSISTPTPTQPQLHLWYESPSVLFHWAQHGRRALADLGIDIISGVVPPNQNGNTGGG